LNKRRQQQTNSSTELSQDNAGEYETSHEIMLHIQTVIRLIDGHLVNLDGINNFIIRLRQRSMDFSQKLNYLFKKPP